MAKLSFKYGAMNSGKSNTIIRSAYNYTERGLSVATVKPSLDTKGEEFIVARGGDSLRVDILADPETNLREAIKRHMGENALKKLNCVLVDESQFFTETQIDQLLAVAKLDKTSVIAFGLKTDFRGHLFPGSKRLFEVADSFEKIPTMCHCGRQAEFHIRKVNGDYVSEGDLIAIDDGSDVEYDSLCAIDYNKYTHFLDPKNTTINQ